jgi:hypothetical protein
MRRQFVAPEPPSPDPRIVPFTAALGDLRAGKCPTRSRGQRGSPAPPQLETIRLTGPLDYYDKGERQIWLEPRSLTACVALRGLVEGYSDTILRLVEFEAKGAS